MFLNPRDNDFQFTDFVQTNHQAVFELFVYLESENNYFAKREGLKTQYMVLHKYEALRKIYVNDKQNLITVMKLVLNENKGIQYEAFLLLSYFILMPRTDDQVINIMKNN